MTFPQLEAFVMAAEQLSFTKAAEKLYITPSALSKSIHLLETELHVSLFERQYRKIVLTECGKLLFEPGKHVVESFHQLENLGHMFHMNVYGCINMLGSGPYSSAFTGAFNAFTEKYPNIHWSIESISRGNQKDTVNKVLQGSYDMGIAYREYLDGYDDLESLFLEDDKVAILVGKSHPLAQRSSIRCCELDEITFLWSDHMIDAIPPAINRHLAELGVPPLRFSNDIQQTVSGRDTLLLLQQGRNAIFAPRAIAMSTIECQLIDIEDFTMPLSIVLFWHRSNANHAVKLFLDYIQTSDPPRSLPFSPVSADP